MEQLLLTIFLGPADFSMGALPGELQRGMEHWTMISLIFLKPEHALKEAGLL